MNKIRVIIVLLLCSLASVAIADEEALVQERMVSIRAEGKQLDGLVIGAQARLDFIYVDAVLVEALRTPSGFPDWLRWHAKDFASEELKGGVLFVLRIETYNPWTFDPMKISVADYALKEEDILTKPAYVPKGDLPSHLRVAFLSRSWFEAETRPGDNHLVWRRQGYLSRPEGEVKCDA